jgi:drug/metabolite transporter (DMT)-like permease
MEELSGVVAAILSSALGGASIVATRSLISACDPLTIGAFRFGVGFAVMAPIALIQGAKWPPREDWLGVAALGLLFFAAFPILFNASLAFTSAARGALALSTLPLLTLVVGAILGVERLTLRKTAGVLIAMAGVTIALLSGLETAPPDAWRGDLLMIAAAFCMALYSVCSRSFIRRSGPIAFSTMGMGVGAVCLIALSGSRGGFASVAAFGAPQWLAVVYLGFIGGAATFFLWAFALARTTPTRVAISVTVNPIAASLLGAALLGEPIALNIVLGLAIVFVGILVATTAGRIGAKPFTPRAEPEK